MLRVKERSEGDVTVRTLPSTSKARKGELSIKTAIVTVTPDMAEGWLAKNTINRPMQAQVVNRYVRDMQNGRWRFTGDAIRFDHEGHILDGQHRLMACVKSGVAFETVIIDGLPTETRDYIDMGFKRSISHVLHFHGFLNTSALAASAQWLLRIKLRASPGGAAGSAKATSPEILECINKHPGLSNSTQLVYSQDRTKKFVLGPPPSLSIAIHYIGGQILGDEDSANAFLDVFQTGKPAYDGDPAHIWRERLVRYRASTITVRKEVHYVGLVHAWNMFRRRESTKLFKVPNDAKIEGLDLKKI